MNSAGSTRPFRVWVVTTATLAVVFLCVAWARRWVCDDAFITFRVVDNVLAGNGPVYNAGERVEAYSHPLWMILLAAWTFLFGHVETGSVLLGLTLALGGIVAASAAVRCTEPKRILLPFGALVVLALPPFWEYATSGLEMGLVMAWLGGSYALLIERRRPLATAVVLGLGPLIRPDLALFTAAFLAALCMGHSRRAVVRLLIAGLALPLAVQVFRMGYFAALVPTPAIAKEAGRANVDQGIRFLMDFVRPYGLYVPIALLMLAAVRSGRTSPGRRAGAAVVVAALLHASFVVWVGGGFMHGRLFLPALFALCLPLWMIPVPSAHAVLRWSAMIGLAAWAILCGTHLRISYEGSIGSAGIADERGYYVALAGVAHPVTLRDYENHIYRNQGDVLRQQARYYSTDAMKTDFPRGAVVIDLTEDPGGPWIDVEHQTVLPLASSVPSAIRLVAGRWNIGLSGYAAGLDVHVVDRRGLADPVAARLRLDTRGRPGHEKALPNPWILARFATFGRGVTPVRSVVEAGEALRQPGVAGLLEAISQPLTAKRFATNIAMAWSTRSLRIP